MLSDPQRRHEYDTRDHGYAESSSNGTDNNDMGSRAYSSGMDPFASSTNRRGGFPPAGFGFQFQDPLQMFNSLFAYEISGRGPTDGQTTNSSTAFFSPFPTFGRQDPFLSNHFAMANMGLGNRGPRRAQQRRAESSWVENGPGLFDGFMSGGSMSNGFGASSFRSSSFQSSSMTGGMDQGVHHHSSRSTYTTHRNGRSETVTRQVAADVSSEHYCPLLLLLTFCFRLSLAMGFLQGTETIHRQSDEGESVTVNGIPQSSHPLLRSGAPSAGPTSQGALSGRKQDPEWRPSFLFRSDQ